ncbi:MAG: TIGR02206 family membrane protein [Phycisphaeraceae bacterium]|nr:MAG: TIGR02206 family membrane protein [Phycisphaeraceae bacterium]
MTPDAPFPVDAAAASAGSWLEEFHSFTLFHLVTVAVCAMVMIGICLLGRRWADTARERRLRIGWCAAIVLWQGFAVVWWLLPSNYELGRSLPLHVCDAAAWIAPFALLTKSKWLRTLLYFWGLGLSTQAFFTPVLEHGAGHLRYWLFWIGHTQIVGSALYDLIARGYRPVFADYIRVSVANAVYAGLLIPFNILLGVNYGYLGDATPDRDTLINALGPWPHRLILMWLIVQIGMLIMWLVWPVAERMRGVMRGRGEAN